MKSMFRSFKKWRGGFQTHNRSSFQMQDIMSMRSRRKNIFLCYKNFFVSKTLRWSSSPECNSRDVSRPTSFHPFFVVMQPGGLDAGWKKRPALLDHRVLMRTGFPFLILFFQIVVLVRDQAAGLPHNCFKVYAVSAQGVVPLCLPARQPACDSDRVATVHRHGGGGALYFRVVRDEIWAWNVLRCGLVGAQVVQVEVCGVKDQDFRPECKNLP